MNPKNSQREYDFALVIGGVTDVTSDVENKLFEAGCDDATFSLQHGRLYAEFSRSAKSLKDAIISAIQDVRKARVGATIMRVDESNLVTQAEIGHRIKRSRQMVFQYISGERGPGNFPSPECCLADKSPLWAWSTVSAWLAENQIIRPEESWNAEVVAAINNALEAAQQQERNPALVKEIVK